MQLINNRKCFYSYAKKWKKKKTSQWFFPIDLKWQIQDVNQFICWLQISALFQNTGKHLSVTPKANYNHQLKQLQTIINSSGQYIPEKAVFYRLLLLENNVQIYWHSCVQKSALWSPIYIFYIYTDMKYNYVYFLKTRMKIISTSFSVPCSLGHSVWLFI